MSRYSAFDGQSDPLTGVLKNLLGITDPATFDAVEADLVAARSRQLTLRPLSGNFDLAHLQAIHNYLFQDLYEWAGQLRTVDISKGTSRFANCAFLHTSAAYIFGQLVKENLLIGLGSKEFSERAAYYLGELNALHPFRDGNGRTQREFMSHLERKNGLILDWADASQQEIITVSEESFHGRLTSLSELIFRITRSA